MKKWIRRYIDMYFTQETLDVVLDLYAGNFFTCNFSELDFDFHDLTGMIFNRCNLRGADLSNCIINSITVFENCEFDENTKMPDVPMACPEEGAFIGYKKAVFGDMMVPDECIVTLQIPEDAKRSSAFGKKCRCDKAKVIEIIALDEEETLLEEAFSCYDASFKYRLGEIVEVKDFNEFRWNECATGIHFFMDTYTAEDYVF